MIDYKKLKDSWHPYDEEPRNHSNIIYLNADGDIYSKQYVKVEGFEHGGILYASLAFVNGLIKMIYRQRKIKMKNKEINFSYGRI